MDDTLAEKGEWQRACAVDSVWEGTPKASPARPAAAGSRSQTAASVAPSAASAAQALRWFGA